MECWYSLFEGVETIFSSDLIAFVVDDDISVCNWPGKLCAVIAACLEEERAAVWVLVEIVEVDFQDDVEERVVVGVLVESVEAAFQEDVVNEVISAIFVVGDVIAVEADMINGTTGFLDVTFSVSKVLSSLDGVVRFGVVPLDN